jgi:2-hydroxychromene-2-carboxylate isomerase
LAALPFWRCDGCGHWVGCHHKTQDRTRPLGCIPSPEIKNARQYIHALLDPLWQNGLIKRSKLYAKMARRLGLKRYHTAAIRSLEEARSAYRAGLAIRRELQGLICFDLSTITRIFLAQARWLKAHPADYDGGSC